jgi:hypothetical protein
MFHPDDGNETERGLDETIFADPRRQPETRDG